MILLCQQSKKPDVDFGFLGKALPSRLTYSCASGNRAYYNANGQMCYAGVNSPRFDHHPVTHEPRGLLIEGARTNYTKKSYPMIDTIDWWGTAATTSPSDIFAMDGLSNFIELRDTSASSSHMLFSSSMTYEAGKSYVFSIYAKAGSHSRFQIVGASGPFGSTLFATFDLQNGIVLEMGTTTQKAGIVPCGNGVYRCWLSGVASASSGVTIALALTNNLIGYGRAPSYVGSGNYVYVYGAQTEQAETPSSYIQTTGTMTTRATDILNADLSHVYRSEGTLYAEYEALYVDGSNARHIISLTGGNYTDCICLGLSWTQIPFLTVRTNNQTALYVPLPDGGSDRKDTVRAIAASYGVVRGAVAQNGFGATVSENALGDAPLALPQMRLGIREASVEPLFGWIRHVSYWNKVLPDISLERAAYV